MVTDKRRKTKRPKGYFADYRRRKSYALKVYVPLAKEELVDYLRNCRNKTGLVIKALEKQMAFEKETAKEVALSDYRDFEKEIHQDLDEHILTAESSVYVVRSAQPVGSSEYRPIADWYYRKPTGDDLLPELMDDEKDLADKRSIAHQIIHDSAMVLAGKEQKVSDVLKEISDFLKLYGAAKSD